jgi:hypothetical protein
VFLGGITFITATIPTATLKFIYLYIYLFFGKEFYMCTISKGKEGFSKRCIGNKNETITI